ncbi:transporter substrate-binding domain-containing protein [Glutamicibacter sp.]|uniref:transporter substrate-binding domain-containing protein n=1 Tax=Glutamicibacter sp. TaxID=1931995 RepID=UPI002B4A865A|nr:transporter substrate-binding domain-containing protein [Glutamicibacter sp.]HJX77060.1 transporter substrate-binding domain-containing protein [Glutamicibacter sp.]
MSPSNSRGGTALISLSLIVVLAGCSQAIPVDPEGTLNTVRNGTLRIGLSPHDSFVEIKGSSYQGSEVELAKDFAQSLGATPEFIVGGEESLVKKLEEDQIDLVVGGISSKTPWSKKVGRTRPYTQAIDEKGKKEKLVLLVPPGENAFLGELEYFLDQTQEMP